MTLFRHRHRLYGGVAVPVITGVTPAAGAVGDPITITGINFGAARGIGSVVFTNTAASFSNSVTVPNILSWSDTQIVVKVPDGLVFPYVGSFIRVTTNTAQGASSAATFTWNFSPASAAVAGLKGWYKADSLGLTDGSGIASWLDSSGNGATLTQGTGANQPIYKTGIQNGLPVARFNGTTQVISSAAYGVALPQPTTLFLVASEANTTAAYVIFDGLTVGARQSVNYQTGGAINLNAGVGITGGVGLTGMNIISVVFNGASSSFWVNGSLIATGNAGANSLDGVRLGQAFNGTAKLPGDIAEAVLYNSSLSTANRRLVEAYLGSRYAITVV